MDIIFKLLVWGRCEWAPRGEHASITQTETEKKEKKFVCREREREKEADEEKGRVEMGACSPHSTHPLHPQTSSLGRCPYNFCSFSSVSFKIGNN